MTCVPAKEQVEVLTPATCVTSFENKVFSNVTKLK